MRIWREFTFEAAHCLPHVPPGHKCGRLHGHSYRVEVHVSGPVSAVTGMVVDFAGLDAAWKPIHEALDHHCLNEVPGLTNPTSEHLARWVWLRLAASVPGLCRVAVSETPRSGAIYEGEDE